MASQKTEWSNLSEVQLKGALVRRGLDTAGKKDELIKRLQDHEEGKTAETVESDHDSEDDGSPILSKRQMNFGYFLSLSMKTVMITPVTLGVLGDEELRAVIEGAASYQLKKTKNGDSAMQVKYATALEGDEAFVEIQKKLADQEDIKVYHPWKDTLLTDTGDSFDSLMKDHHRGSTVERCVVLTNLPESLNTEARLTELFPEASDVFSYQYEPGSKGMAILDFLNPDEASSFLKTSGEEMELEGEKIALNKYIKKVSLYNRTQTYRNKKKDPKEPSPLTDQDRINKTAELREMEEELRKLQNSTETVGQEKFSKFVDLEEKYNDASRDYRSDTHRRIRAGQTEMPEGEENLLNSTKAALRKVKSLSDDKAVKDTESSDYRNRKRTTDYKRGTMSTLRGRGRGSSFNGRSQVGRGASRRGVGQKRNIGRSSYGDSYDQPPSKRYSMDGNRGSRSEPASSVKLIEGLTSVLTDKMQTLERLQEQTLKTQAQLISGGDRHSSSGGYGDSSGSYGNTSGYGGGNYSSNTSGSYGGGNYGGSNYGSSTNNSGGGGSNYGFNSGRSYGGNASGFTGGSSGGGGSGYGGSSGGGYSGGGGSGSYYASPPSNKKGGTGNYRKGTGRYRKR